MSAFLEFLNHILFKISAAKRKFIALEGSQGEIEEVYI